MKKEVKAAQKAEDFEKLVVVLEKVSTLAPKGYDEWSSIAKAGAEAAKQKDADAVKRACKSCHKKYEDKFIAEHRTEELL